MKKILCLLLSVLMLIMAIGCKRQEQEPETEISSVSTEADLGRAGVKDSLPDDLNFNQLQLNIMYRNTDRCHAYEAEGDSALDSVSSAVFARNISVEERLNTDLNYIKMDGATWQETMMFLKTYLLSASNEIDFVYSTGNTTIQSGLTVYFQDMSNAKYLDYTKPWWNNAAMEELSIDGNSKRYLVGDIVPTALLNTGAVFVNKNLYASTFGNVDELCDLVNDRKWTLEKFCKIVKETRDSYDGSDKWGFLVQDTAFINILNYSNNISFYTRGEDGIPVLNVYSERSQMLFENIYSFYWENTGVRQNTSFSDENNNIGSDFANGKSMFYGSVLDAAFRDYMRNMSDTYGVLPIPLVDEVQEEYVSLTNNNATRVMVPLSCIHMDEVSAAIEALCAESYRHVTEEVYDIALKIKYSSDDKWSQIIDIINKTSKMNFIYEHSSQLNKIGVLIATCVKNENYSFSSEHDKLISAANGGMEKLKLMYQ